MDFQPSEMEREIRDLARKILEESATQDRLREVERGDVNFDAALWAALAKANLLGVALPEDQGGMGQGFGELAVLIEECGRAVAPLPSIPTLVGGALPIARFGSDAQRARILPEVARGASLLACALEDADGADPLCLMNSRRFVIAAPFAEMYGAARPSRQVGSNRVSVRSAREVI
jgi:alkylation response protein AidB-like acyl-CoA dehydrogenase